MFKSLSKYTMYLDLYYEKKIETVMDNNSAKINKTNNHLSH